MREPVAAVVLRLSNSTACVLSASGKAFHLIAGDSITVHHGEQPSVVLELKESVHESVDEVLAFDVLAFWWEHHPAFFNVAVRIPSQAVALGRFTDHFSWSVEDSL